MTEDITIIVFGANGKVGSHFVNQALDAGYKLKAFVRSANKFKHSENPNVEVFEGDAANYDDVERVIKGANIVVSCLGNTSKVRIMAKAYDNIMKAAVKQLRPPRCIMISSIGLGGSSWFVKFLLTLIAGRRPISDFEKADKRVREEEKVPYVLVRASGLNDKQGKGKYHIIDKDSVFFPKFISRSDVAKFFVDSLKNTSYDKRAVMIEGV